MSAKSIKKNYIYNLTYQILTLITPFITTPYITRILLPYGVGLQSFAYAVAQYFGVFAGMGIGIFGQREISYFQDNRKERTRIFWELKELSLITTLIWLAIYLTLVRIYVKNQYLLFYILSLNIIGVFADTSWFFFGMEEFGKIVIRQIIFKIADILFIFLFIKKQSDLPLHVFGSVFLGMMPTIVMWAELPKYIDWPDWKSLNPFRDIKIIISLFIPTIAIQIYTVLDKLMLGVLTEGSIENGYYELALRISRMPLMLVGALGGVLIPRIGYLFKKDNNALINEYMSISFKFAWFLSVPLCLGLISVSDNFVGWFFGDYYTKVSELLKISSFILIPIGIHNITGTQYLIPTGRQNLFTLSVVLGAIVNFTLNLILISLYKSDGALIASVIAEFVVAGSQLFVLRKEFSFMKIISYGKNYFIAGLVMFLILMSFNKKLSPSALNTFIIIFAGVFIYFVTLLILRDEFFISNAGRVFEKLSKKFRRE